MNDFFYLAYIYANLAYSALLAIFSLMFAFLSVPKIDILNSYRICLKILIVAYVILSITGFFDSIGQLMNPVYNMQLALDDTLISSSFASVLFLVVIISIVNVDYISTSYYITKTAIVLLFTALLITSRAIPWPVDVQKGIYTIFSILYVSQLIYAIAKIITQDKWARTRINAYFSGREIEFLRWTRLSAALMAGIGVFSLLLLIFQTWLIATIFSIAASVLTIIVSIRYLNYPYVFQVFIPILHQKADTESNGYTKSKLEGLDIAYLKIQIESYMEKNKPFLDAELSIADLSEKLGLTIHQLSEFINLHCGRNFRSFVNSFRINCFKREIEKNPEFSILETAMHCGFNSKSTFNHVFRQETGHTPRSWVTAYQSDSE